MLCEGEGLIESGLSSPSHRDPGLGSSALPAVQPLPSDRWSDASTGRVGVRSCGEVSARVKERLDTMKISGQRLCNLIDDILDAASLNNSSLRLVDEDVPLAAVCEHVMHLTKAVLRKVIRIPTPAPTPGIAFGRRERVRGALGIVRGHRVRRSGWRAQWPAP
jgi:signal transduction histidine kinase